MTPDRLTAAIAARATPVCVALVVGYAVAIAVMAATANGAVDVAGRPLGTDFSSFWSAGRLALSGAPEAAYDFGRLHAVQREAFGPATAFYPFPYPPPFLAAAASFATLPYLAGLAVWQLATLALYLAALLRISDENRTRLLLAGLAFPAVFVNLTHGQTGFLAAALFGWGLVLLDRRPALAGVLLGLLAFKPQFGLLLPFALMATGRWRAFAAAAATVLALVGGSLALFGPDAWAAFLAGASATREIMLEGGATGWHKIMSAFAFARSLGAPAAGAYALQGLVALGALVLVLRLWRSAAPFGAKAAGLLAGSLLATPYALDYDLMLFAPALAFLAAAERREPVRGGEAAALAFVFLAPLLARSVAGAAFVPVGLIAAATLLAVALRFDAARRAPETAAAQG